MFTFQYTINLITEKLCLEDITDWTSLGFDVNTDTFSYNYIVKNPLGEVIYETTTSDINNKCVDLSTITGGDIMEGEYDISIEVEINGTDNYDLNKKVKVCDSYSATENIELDITCYNSTLKSYDKTNYGTYKNITREHTLFYPPSLELDEKVTTNILNKVTPIYTGTWTVRTINTVTYEVETNILLIKKFEFTKEFVVSCDNSLCKFICCFDKFRTRMIAKMKVNPTEGDKMLKSYTLAFNEWTLAKNMIDCGKEVPQNIYDNIYSLLECSEDCCCGEDDEPTLIPPIIGGDNGEDKYLEDVDIIEDNGVYTIVHTMSDGTIFENELPVSTIEEGTGQSLVLYNEIYSELESKPSTGSTQGNAVDLMTYDINTSVFANNGDYVKVSYMLEMVEQDSGTINTYVYFYGNTLIFVPYSDTTTNNVVYSEFILIRKNDELYIGPSDILTNPLDTSYKLYKLSDIDNESGGLYSNDIVIDLSLDQDIPLVISGQNRTGESDDVFGRMLRVEYFPIGTLNGSLIAGPQGDDGDAGDDGENGTTLLFNEFYDYADNTAPTTSTGTGIEDLITHQVNSLADGDCIKVKATWRYKSDDVYLKRSLVSIDSTVIALHGQTDTLGGFFINKRTTIECEIYREGSKIYSTHSLKVGNSIFGNLYDVSPREIKEVLSGVTDSTSFVIKMQGENGDDNQSLVGPNFGDNLVIAEQLMITLIKK